MTSLGYVPTFLSKSVPLPAAERELRRLEYTHFTVLLDPVRRLAAATAVNIDGDLLLDVPRSDDWRLDPRVPASEQAGAELYARNALDRGHLVRRRDPVWGAFEIAERANRDTFFYTNAAPQAAEFNQSKELWVGLEDHVLNYARTHRHRISVFTGPVLHPDDPIYRAVAIPLLYWKVATWPAQAGLRSTGFVLDQTPTVALPVRPDEPPPLGPFRMFQVPVADIAELTGLNLGPLVDADVLTPPATDAARPRAGWVPVLQPEEIAL